MRPIALVLSIACLVLAAPPAAKARFVLGIGDQSTAMRGDPRFAALGVRDSRVVVPWDVALDPAQLARYAPLFDLARARGVRMLVAFGASARDPGRLPSVRGYGRAVRALPSLAADRAPPRADGAAVRGAAAHVPAMPDGRCAGPGRAAGHQRRRRRAPSPGSVMLPPRERRMR